MQVLSFVGLLERSALNLNENTKKERKTHKHIHSLRETQLSDDRNRQYLVSPHPEIQQWYIHRFLNLMLP